MSMNDHRTWEDIQRDVLTANTAQIVYQHLRNLESRRERVQTRWIWELLQNALDASSDDVGSLTCSIEYCSGQSTLIFRHNGHEFKKDEVAHLIYHGSTKAEDETKIGQYGSGFLTTHLLSWKVNISGQLEDGQNFDFWLERKPTSIQAVDDFMKEAADRFNESLSGSSAMHDGFTTRFLYPMVDGENEIVVGQGISALMVMAPLIAAFNRVFDQVGIESSDGAISFGINRCQKLTDNGLYEVTVAITENGVGEEKTYILAEGSKTTVATQVHQIDGSRGCLPPGDVPKLFLGLPLIGTENFSFPAIINSFKFTPSDGDRDGVNLWLNENDEANITNQNVITESFNLLVRLIQFMTSSGWKNIYTLADIPPIVTGQNWINAERLREHIIEHLVKPVRQNPAVVCQMGTDALSPEDAILPFTEDDSQVQALWDLLSGLKDLRRRLPRRDESGGWCNAIKSWASICECEPSNFGEAFDGQKLAELVEEQCDNLEELQDLLVDGVCAVKWLNELYVFLKDNDFGDEIHARSFILDQGGYLDTLSSLYCDQGIDDELKDIADALDLEVRRAFLRDNRLTSLSDESGAGNKENKDVVQDIIARLREMVDDKDLNDKFAKSSVRLFGWIVDNQGWDYLRQYPAFCRAVNDREKEVVWLGRIDQDNSEVPLAPINAWPEDLQQFAELFPPTQILADEIYEATPDSNVWALLTERNIVRTGVITVSNAEVNFEVFLPNEPLNEDVEHRTLNPVAVSDVAFLQKDNIGTMERIRRSQRRARLFWRFVTEYMAIYDTEGLEVKEKPCGCDADATHSYYQSAWLMPLVNNKWVPLGNSASVQVTAQSLANLLRDSDALPIPDNDAVNKLLEAIRISRFDLMRESMSSDDETRDAMDNRLMNIMAKAQDNPDRLDAVPQFLEQLKEDEGLVEYIEERRQRRNTVHQNQQFGRLVEDLVEKTLRSEGFKVKRTHVGADLIIESKSSQSNDVSEDDVTELEVSKNNRTWLVEVKATRSNDARMTPVQAQKAVDEDDGFLLCVVPVDSDSEPELEDVRSNMRFVADIGSRVYSLCNDLDDFEQQRSDITANYGDGFQLVVMSGTTRIRVDKSVWENDGFSLSELPARLK